MNEKKLIILAIGIVVLPVLFVILCNKMNKEKVPRAPYFAYFVIILTFIIMTLAYVFPNIGLLEYKRGIFFAIPIVLILSSSIHLIIFRNNNPYHNIALMINIAYLIFAGFVHIRSLA